MELRLQPHSLKGISILEAITVLVILGLILSSVIPICIDRVNRAKYEKMINEMTSIAQASIDFYNSQYPNTWPTDINQLAPKYMNYAVNSNPWGNGYTLNEPNNGNSGLVQVSSVIPSGVVENNPQGPMVMVNALSGTSDETVSIAQSVTNEGIGRLQYEKKYTYNQ